MLSLNEERKMMKKIKRYRHTISLETGIEYSHNPTRFIIICNAGLATGLKLEVLIETVMKFGNLHDVFMVPGKSYCFLELISEHDSQNVYKSMHGLAKLAQNNCKIYMDYCMAVPEYKNPWAQELPSGLILIEDIINDEEEAKLIDCIKWSEDCTPNMQSLKHRQVQHYGFEFLYDSNNIDKEKPLDRKIPAECNIIWDRLHLLNSTYSSFPPDQMTVNKYEPGQGIPPHVDTHSAFIDPIISLSLGSDTVMEFREPDSNSHRFVNVPRKSLLIISGESRYAWTHAITPRVMDIVPLANNLTIRNRSTRISFTFRGLKDGPCDCKYHKLCDSYKPNSTEDFNPSEMEQMNVHNVYNKIANHFSQTRHSPWPQVESFIKDLPSDSILIDIGCGNGKYLNINEHVLKIGCDRSSELLKVCLGRNFNIFQCDCLAVPLRDQSVDACISIAVVHHLASKERRLKALSEMSRILVPGGRALIYVWAKNQEANKQESSYLRQKKNNKCTNESVPLNTTLPIHENRTKFQHQDILVPWKLKNNKEYTENTFLRYYHVFEENELELLLKEIPFIKITKSYYDQGNWCAVFERL